jgi:SAM-dependent methyltransferase
VAQFYDYLMRHVNYARWASYVVNLFDLANLGGADELSCPHRPQVRTVLELACGTGRLLVKLSEAGFRMYGMDRSASMAQSAAARCQSAGVPAQVWCGDMRDFAIELKLDAVICLYDSINYCRKLEEVTGVFACVAQALRPGGLFIFDICTRWNCWRNFRNYTDREEWGRLTYHRHSFYRPIGNLQYNEFLVESADHPGETLRELHVQRIYSLGEIRKIAATGPWEPAGCFKDMSRRSGNERAERVHFVFRRKS